jgi:hypothetical protein
MSALSSGAVSSMLLVRTATRQRVQGEVRIAALEFPCPRVQAVAYRAYRLCAMRPWRWPSLLVPWQIFHSGATHLKTVARERLLC